MSLELGSDITIHIEEGRTVQAGSADSSVGVVMLGGMENRLTNRGIITTLNGVAGSAIIGTDGNETIENEGRIVGSGISSAHPLSLRYLALPV